MFAGQSTGLRPIQLGILALGPMFVVLGCFTSPTVDLDKIKCQVKDDCPSGLVCTNPGASGRCCKPDDLACAAGVDASSPEVGVTGSLDLAALDQAPLADQSPAFDQAQQPDLAQQPDMVQPSDLGLVEAPAGEVAGGSPDLPIPDAPITTPDGNGPSTESGGLAAEAPPVDVAGGVDVATVASCLAAADGTPCGDGMVCNQALCVACSAGGSCPSSDPCHKAVWSCSTGVRVCLDSGSADDGASCGSGNVCKGGSCTACVSGGSCPVPGYPCRTGVLSCSAGVSSCADNGAKPNGDPCDDGDACTSNDSCQAGTCKGTATVCQASDQCHLAGLCNSVTGACSNPTRPDTTSCSDGNACTSGDTCQSGVCIGGAKKVCTAKDQCHQAGICDASSGACSEPLLPNNTGCEDGLLCTTGETCQNGICTGAVAKICPDPTVCHDRGTCDPGTGKCSNPAQGNGTGCSDNNLCTTGDSCQGGACVPGTQKDCGASSDCWYQPACEPTTGLCPPGEGSNGNSCCDSYGCGMCLNGYCDY